MTPKGAGRSTPTHRRASSTNCAEVCAREGRAGEEHLHVACGTQEEVPANVKAAFGAGILGAGLCE